MPSDREIVERFLSHFSDYSGAEVAARVPEVTQHDVSRWRRGDFQRLSGTKRRALQAAIAVAEDAVSPVGEVGAVESLLYSKRALMRTLTDFGGPGERRDDKLFLVRLLQAVAQDLKRQGRQVTWAHLLDAERDILDGRL